MRLSCVDRFISSVKIQLVEYVDISYANKGCFMEQKTRTKATENPSVPTFERYAIIQTGGKQYQAIEGKTIAIEKIEGEAGAQLEFDALLRKMGPGEIQIGQPTLPTKVKASIVKQMKAPKVIVFKFKRRKKSRVKKGHRQLMTVVRIESI